MRRLRGLMARVIRLNAALLTRFIDFRKLQRPLLPTAVSHGCFDAG